MTDPIADMLTRIRNAALVKKEFVVFPSSRLKLNILKVFKNENYIEDFTEERNGPFKAIKVKLRYENKKPAISFVERISKPGRRVYSKKSDIPTILSGSGMVVISTPKGIMTGKEAKSQGVGGELVCKIY